VQRDDWETKRRFAAEIASGMSLVHSLGRIHRDLKSGNVLATTHKGRVTLKVADFGTVTLAGNRRRELNSVPSLADLPEALTKGIGTPRWMAPEILAGQPYGISADVYSYGIVLWEIAAQTKPWSDVRTSFLYDALLRAIDDGRRPHVDPAWPADYVSLMQRCWARDPRQRPTFKDILAELKPMMGSTAV
jgi:serine/threonine protein kinase